MADSSGVAEISKMKVADLKRELKMRGLSTNGNKTELVDRLQSAFENDNGKIDGLSLDIEDVLNDETLVDDDIDVADAEKELDASIMSQEESSLELARSIQQKTVTKRKADVIQDSKVAPKKIVLNRALSVSTPAVPKASTEENKSPTSLSTSEKSDDKKVVKLSNLTAKERLEMRAKKFGAPVATDLKKEARLKRFGSTNSDTSSAAVSSISTSEPSKLDILKKRAERFGGSVSTVLSKLDVNERMERRKARFGVQQTVK